MLIVCPHCQSPLRVRTSRQVVDSVRDYYCNCDNEICLARPVMTMAHKHDIQPPIYKRTSAETLVERLIDSLTITERNRILDKIQKTNMSLSGQ